MTDYPDFNELLAVSTAPDEKDVTLSSGRKVRVRGLTRFELINNGKGTEDSAVIEQRNLASCMVEPKMTREQAAAWQKVAKVNDIAKVSDAIRDLSGLGEGADKSNVAEAGD